MHRRDILVRLVKKCRTLASHFYSPGRINSAWGGLKPTPNNIPIILGARFNATLAEFIPQGEITTDYPRRARIFSTTSVMRSIPPRG